jgi:hypothetical protein
MTTRYPTACGRDGLALPTTLSGTGDWATGLQTLICAVKLMPFPFSLRRVFSTRPNTSLASSLPPYSLVSKVNVSRCRTSLPADPFPAQKRNLPKTVVASLVLLGSVGSLGFAQSLFFIIMLHMPPVERRATGPLHHSLSTPHREFYYYPLALVLLTLGFLPGALRNGNSLSPLRSVYLLAPFFFAFLPEVCMSILTSRVRYF